MGLACGVVVLVAVMLLWNYLITPIYQGVPREVVVGMLPTVFFPFNLAKGGLNMAATLLLYKPVVTALRKANLVPSKASSNGSSKKTGVMILGLILLVTCILLLLVFQGKI